MSQQSADTADGHLMGLLRSAVRVFAGHLGVLWVAGVLAVGVFGWSSMAPVAAQSDDGDSSRSVTSESTTSSESVPETDDSGSSGQRSSGASGTTPTSRSDGSTSTVEDGTGQSADPVDGGVDSSQVSTDTVTGDSDHQGPAASDPSSSSPSSVQGASTSSPSSTDSPSTDSPPADTSSTSTTIDPLINEQPGDIESPDPNITVPPPAYDQAIFAPAPVLWSSVTQAEEKLAGLRDTRRELIATVRSLRQRQKELEYARLSLGAGSGQAVADYNESAERLRKRAVLGYVELSSGSTDDLNFAFDLTAIPDVIEQQRKSRFLSAALSVDRATMDEFTALKERLDADSIDLVEHGRAVSVALRSAERRTGEVSAEVDQALIEAEAFRAGSEIYVDGVVFPIAGNYSTPLIDSFGFPRMPGTPDAHWHQGIDIFAPRGTPLVAAERGVVVRIGNGRLGGLKFWLRGESGADWYYAHLDSFAPGLHNGQVVQAGELLGYVGNTGNAIGTPPHLHLEIRPGGGRPVNPYPLMRIVSDLELDAVASGTHPGFRYQPRIVSRGVPVDEQQESTTSSSEPGAEGDQSESGDAPSTTVASDVASNGGGQRQSTTTTSEQVASTDENKSTTTDATDNPANGDPTASTAPAGAGPAADSPAGGQDDENGTEPPVESDLERAVQREAGTSVGGEATVGGTTEGEP